MPSRTIYKVRNRCLQPAVALCLIFRFPIRYRLPLHIERCICSTAFGRIDVIDDLSRTAAAGSAPVAALMSRPRAVRAEGGAMAMAVPRSGEGIERSE